MDRRTGAAGVPQGHTRIELESNHEGTVLPENWTRTSTSLPVEAGDATDGPPVWSLPAQ